MDIYVFVCIFKKEHVTILGPKNRTFLQQNDKFKRTVNFSTEWRFRFVKKSRGFKTIKIF